MRIAGVLSLVALGFAMAACGGDDPVVDADRIGAPPVRRVPAAPPPRRRATRPTLVAALGDSITAGSPLWDPSREIREQLGDAQNPESQWTYWAQRRMGRLVRFRNCGVPGEYTHQIAERLAECARGAQALVVQGGINDLARGVPVAEVVGNLEGMVKEGKRRGLRVGLVNILPWNNGYPDAVAMVKAANRAIDEIGRRHRVPVYDFYEVLDDPRRPGRMPDDLTIDGDHPTVLGYRLAANAFELP